MEQLFHFHTGADGVIKVNGNPFDCSILLKNMYTVEEVGLETVEMAHGFYNIRSPFDTFTVDGSSYSIPAGNYTIDTLLAAMSTASGYTFEKVGDRIINEYATETVIYGFNTDFAAPYQTVSNNGLTVTALPSMWLGQQEPTMLSLYKIPPGVQVMFSVKAGYVPNIQGFTCVGLASNAFIAAGYTTTYLSGGDGTNSVAFFEDGSYLSSAGNQNPGFTSGFTTGDIIDLMLETTYFNIKMRVNGGPWSNKQNFSFMQNQEPYYFGVCVYGDDGGAGSMTLQTTALYPPPSGYNFVSPLLDTIKWDSIMLTPDYYLTNSDKTVNATSILPPTSMITNYPISDGSKVMFSLNMNSNAESNYNFLGIGNLNFKQYDSKNVPINIVSSNCVSIFQHDGTFNNIYVSGEPLGNSPGWNSGDTVDVCIDTNNYLLWYRSNGGPWSADNSGASYPNNAGPTWNGPGNPAVGGGGAYLAYLNTAPPYYLGITIDFSSSATIQTTALYPPPTGFTFIPQPPAQGILTVTPNSLLNLLGYSIGHPSGTSTNSYSFPFDKYITIWMENIGTSSNENQKITYKVPISSAKTFWSNNSFNKQIVMNQNSQFPLNRLNIQVLDQFGNKMNNNLVDWSFTLKVKGRRCHPQ